MNTILVIIWKSLSSIYTRIQRDSVLREASALTYQSTLAIVPLLAILFGIAQGFGLETILTNWLKREFADHQEVLSYLMQFSQSSLQKAKGSVIAGCGVILLVITSFRLLASMESAMNSMWGISRQRPWSQRLGSYLVTLVVGPFLLATSSSITLFISANLAKIFSQLPFGATFTQQALALIPISTSAILFAFLLYSIPNAPVRKMPVLCIGVIAALFFQVLQTYYVYFQLHFTQISAIYGSFLALPLFLVWLWLSWLTLLVAGECVVFFQEKGWKEGVLSYSDSHLEQVALDVMILQHAIRFFRSEQVLLLSVLYEQQIAPAQAVGQSVSRLTKKGLLHTSSQGKDVSISPNFAAFSYRLSDYVLPEMRQSQSSSAKQLQHSLDLWKQLLATCEENPTIGQIGQEL